MTISWLAVWLVACSGGIDGGTRSQGAPGRAAAGEDVTAPGGAVDANGNQVDGAAGPSGAVDPVTGEPTTGDPATGVDPSTGEPSTAGSDPNAAADPAPLPGTDPGRVTMHRLNRAEYNNTVRDLLGTTQRPADDFPVDDRGAGFDNLSDVLSLSTLHLSQYRSAAEALVEEAFANSTQRASLVPCDIQAAGEACARQTLTEFMPRAWRRPVAAAEVESRMTPVLAAIDQGGDYEQGLKLALQSVLLSPYFVFRPEIDPDPTSLVPRALNGYELASRLSYFLWSSMPDTELLGLADAGTLTDPTAVSAQVTRMLQDPKSQALVDNFAGQWLYLRATEDANPDPVLFPTFDESLRAAMRTESELVFGELLSGTLGLNQLLTGEFTYLNDRLAQHYGLPAVGSDQMTRVDLTGNQERGGFLSHASFLTVTSHPNRTSLVRRGKWVLRELMCANVPDPPGDLEIPDLSAVDPNASQREQLEAHRADPTCASCHQIMDPIGFGLENYDAIGAYRTMDGNSPIDSSGQLPDGRPFSGAKELAALLVDGPDFARCTVSKLYTYALGRLPQDTPDHMDPYILRTLSDHLEASQSFPQLLAEMATSDTFLLRRGEEGGAP